MPLNRDQVEARAAAGTGARHPHLAHLHARVERIARFGDRAHQRVVQQVLGLVGSARLR